MSTISSLSGIQVHSIRQYIDRGLIIPFKKDSNRNLFSQVDISRLRYIHKLLDKDGLNITGIRALLSLIPCWSITKCSLKERETCQSYHNDAYPCWEAAEKGTRCKNTNCRECVVYSFVEDYPDIKSLFKKLLP